MPRWWQIISDPPSSAPSDHVMADRGKARLHGEQYRDNQTEDAQSGEMAPHWARD